MKQNNNVKRWFHGPAFFWKLEITWHNEGGQYSINEDDAEVKMTINVNATQIKNCVLSTLELRISSWKKMKIIMGYILLFIQKMKESITIIRRQEQKCEEELLNEERIKEGEVMILKLAQENAFAADIAAIRKKSQIIDGQQDERLQKKTLQNLKPFVDEKGLVRVAGRLQNSSLEMECMHPIILQKNDTISTLIIRYCHDVVAHGGRGALMQEIRKTGYWIINRNALVRKVIHDCKMCRNMRGRFGEQIMADLPKDRVSESPPFTYCGLDIFRPFLVKERRSELKRYGALFTCLASRAVHIEVVATMNTDSFIMALRRMIARRDNIQMIRSDNGSNFVGTENELKRVFQEMDHVKIKCFLQDKRTD